jgi:rhodanese-related sulfurtransferase
MLGRRYFGTLLPLALFACTSNSAPNLDASSTDAFIPTQDTRADAKIADAKVPDLSMASLDVLTGPDLLFASDRYAAESGQLSDSAHPALDSGSVDAALGDTQSEDSVGETGCAGWTTLQHLSPADAANLIATSDPIVINVHIPYAGDIPGTDTDISYKNVDAIEAYLGYDHCADVLLVCESGGMSQSAGNELIKRGYLRVRDLNGGMSAWSSAGYPLLKDGGT